MTFSRTLILTGFAVATLAAAPVFAQAPTAAAPAATTPAATTTVTTTTATTASKPNPEVEARIKGLHDSLKITKDEETQWATVAQVMRDNAAATKAAYEQREAKQGTMTAVDDMRSYQQLTSDRAADIGKLADAFTPLYTAMSPDQQKLADAVFAHKAEKAAKKVEKKTK